MKNIYENIKNDHFKNSIFLRLKYRKKFNYGNRTKLEELTRSTNVAVFRAGDGNPRDKLMWQQSQGTFASSVKIRF